MGLIKSTKEEKKLWAFWIFLTTGIIYGYINFRFGLRAFFVMTDTEGIKTLIIIIGGYLSLLPLTVIGIPLRSASSIILAVLTLLAFIAGINPHAQSSILFMLGRFVLPNLAIASLMALSKRSNFMR